MHINLLIGLAALLGVFWLVTSYRKSRVRPGDMLKDELEKRRARQELAARAERRLNELRDERMRGMEDALQSMREALPEEDRKAGALTWERVDGKIAVHVRKRGSKPYGAAAGDSSENGPAANGAGAPDEAGEAGEANEAFFIRWDVREFDLEALAYSGSPGGMAGEYVLQWGEGRQSREEDMAEFMRMVSAIIADRIA